MLRKYEFKMRLDDGSEDTMIVSASNIAYADWRAQEIAELNNATVVEDSLSQIGGPPESIDDSEIGLHIGEKIKEVISNYRNEAFELKKLADAITEAWQYWDVETLLRLDVISDKEADDILAKIKRQEG